MTHRCHADDCTAQVAHNIFMCARHWRMVPKPLRDAISSGWSMGGGSPYRANCVEAIRVVATLEAGRAMPGLVPGMKALTLWQPWASLIMIGAKPYEFRRWNFADRPGLRKLIGQRTIVHAGARPIKKGELEDIRDRIDEGESALVAAVARPFIQDLIDGKTTVPLAAALGTAIFGEPRKSFDLFKHFVADSDRLDQQMYAWPVSDPQPFPDPAPASGAQGFWKWS
jgi:hypothetical protein